MNLSIVSVIKFSVADLPAIRFTEVLASKISLFTSEEMKNS
jgi:hypothetical protein